MTARAPEPPHVTVAVCTYNRARLLGATLAAMSKQDYPPDRCEILVIDNNSTDDTRAVVAGFGAATPAPRHILETRQGLNHARNRALDEAKGEIIVFADDDILMAPDWLRELVRPFVEHPGCPIGCVGGEVVPVFPEGAPAWIRTWHAPLAFRTDAGPLAEPDSPMGANFAFPRALFADIGPFATGLDRKGASLLGGGDGEMIRRVRAAGREIWFAPAAVVKHQMPASRTTFRYAARHAFDSARSRVLERAARSDRGRYLTSRLPANLLKVPVYALLALLNLILLRRDATKQALVRSWRACGYVYQITRSLCGKL